MELRRIFGEDAEVIEVSHLGVDADTLVEAIREAGPDAVVLATAPLGHRQAIAGLAGELLILRPMFKRGAQQPGRGGAAVSGPGSSAHRRPDRATGRWRLR